MKTGLLQILIKNHDMVAQRGKISVQVLHYHFIARWGIKARGKAYFAYSGRGGGWQILAEHAYCFCFKKESVACL